MGRVIRKFANGFAVKFAEKQQRDDLVRLGRSLGRCSSRPETGRIDLNSFLTKDWRRSPCAIGCDPVRPQSLRALVSEVLECPSLMPSSPRQRSPEHTAQAAASSGVITEGPLVQAKLRESYLLLGILYVGAVAGIIWAVTQGIGKVELFTFAWMFALTTFGIGAGMHRLFVHRSFRTGPIMRVLLLRHRPDGRAGLDREMGRQPPPPSPLCR